MSGSRHPVRGSVKQADNERGIIIPGEAVGESEEFKVWGGDSVGVSGSPSTDASREGSERETALGDHRPWRISMNLQDGFPNRRGTKELFHQGVLGTGRDANGNAGPLYTSACPGNRD